MLRVTQKLSLLLLLSCLSGSVAAQMPSVPNGTTTPAVPTTPTPATSTVQTYFCPAPSQLIKNGLYWGTATGNWISYSESLDTTITGFLGAQWVGVNVGKMICLYKGNLPTSFPITLQNDTLSQAPVGNLWGRDLGGYRNCHSNQTKDCPFVVKTDETTIQDVYKSLDFFKGKPSPLQSTTPG